MCVCVVFSIPRLPIYIYPGEIVIGHVMMTPSLYRGSPWRVMSFIAFVHLREEVARRKMDGIWLPRGTKDTGKIRQIKISNSFQTLVYARHKIENKNMTCSICVENANAQ